MRAYELNLRVPLNVGNSKNRYLEQQAGTWQQKLIYAILICAITDYRYAVKNCKDEYKAYIIKKDCIDFVKSQWFQLLTNLDSDLFINLMKKYAEEELPPLPQSTKEGNRNKLHRH